VAAGLGHTIALQMDGAVRCWGNNTWGQCEPWYNVTANSLSGGYGTTVVIKGGGSVECRGLNNYGQCNTPNDLGGCVAIAGGDDHTVAIRGDGTVRVWGSNIYNQVNLPADLGSCAYVAAGSYHSIVIQGLPPSDIDGDGDPDTLDNCPTIANPLQADCNSNGIGDVCEIAAGTPDFNHDTIPDTCQCLADLFIDHQVNGADLGALLSQWGPATVNTASDMNRDGVVNGADLGYLLNAWGPCTN
jgi:hypothetical protein